MDKTSNYNLNQWSKDDRVLMEDFNADNAKLDAAIKAQANALASLQAAVSALQTAVSKKQDAASAVKLTFGTYIGNGEESQTIYLPFTPKAVLVFDQAGQVSESYTSQYYGGLAFPGHPASAPSQTVLSVTTNGFTVFYKNDSNSKRSFTNAHGRNFYYIAFA